jgi:hypothetical protein
MPCFRPEIEGIMQIDIGQQWRYYRPLWRTYLTFRPRSVLGYPCLQPFLDQAQYPRIPYSMLHELDNPFVRHVVEKSPNVQVQHPVHSLPRDSYRQRIQRLMLATPRPKPVGESQEVVLIDLVENRDHGVLDNLILQRRNPHWTLPPVGLRNVDSP